MASPIIELARNAFWVIEHDPSLHYVRLRRTAAPFRSLADVRSQGALATQAFQGLYRPHLGVLLDVRAGPLRNDPEFEAAIRELPSIVLAQFARSAVLVGTQVGKLQVMRIGRDAGRAEDERPVFDDEAAAVAYVAGLAPAPAHHHHHGTPVRRRSAP